LLCEEGNCRRLGHLANTEILGSDSAARDALKTAACFMHSLGMEWDHPDIPDINTIQAALKMHTNTFRSSSMGRLFDAVAAILGICRENSYEGECAVMLQYAAEKEAEAGIKPLEMRFNMNTLFSQSTAQSINQVIFDYTDIIEKCLTQQQGAALGFHNAISCMIEDMCLKIRETENINDIALSGGAFQNTLLLEMVNKRLCPLGFNVYTNEAVPPNDGGLAPGQAFIALKKLQEYCYVHSDSNENFKY